MIRVVYNHLYGKFREGGGEVKRSNQAMSENQQRVKGEKGRPNPYAQPSQAYYAGCQKYTDRGAPIYGTTGVAHCQW